MFRIAFDPLLEPIDGVDKDMVLVFFQTNEVIWKKEQKGIDLTTSKLY